MEQTTPCCSLMLEEGIVLALQQAWEFAAFQDRLCLDQAINLNLPVFALGLIVNGEVVTSWSGISNLVESCLKLVLLGETTIGVVLDVRLLLTLLILEA